METTTTTTQDGSRLLFSRYKDGRDISWSLRWKRQDGKRTTLCRSQKDSGAATVSIMEELFDDPRVEAILADLMRRHGEP